MQFIVKYRLQLLLYMVGFLTYASSLFNHFVWDDEQFIYENTFVQNFNVGMIFTTNTIAGAGHVSNYYRPLTTLSFAIDHAIWGFTPFGFHLTNTVLHCLAGVLLFGILKQLKFKDSPAFWIATLFLIHPLQTEAVTYANSRGDSLFTFYAFLGVFSWLKFLAKDQIPLQKQLIKSLELNKKNRNYLYIAWGVLAWVAYPLSILSKEIGIASIGLYGLTFLYWNWAQQKKTSVWKFLTKKLWQNQGEVWILYFLGGVTGTYLVLRQTVLNFTDSLNLFGDTVYGNSLFVRMLTYTTVLPQYVGLIFVPYPLHMERHVIPLETLASPWPWITTVSVLSVLGLGIWSWIKKQNLKILFGTLWFLGMLVPVSGIIPINGIMYEHWLYVPMVGFYVMIWGIIELLSPKFSIKTPHLGKIVMLSISVVLIGLTIRQNYLWGTPIRFYSYLLNYTDSVRIRNNLGMAFAEAERYEDALNQYELARETFEYPQVYHNMGNTYLDLNQRQAAYDAYQKAVEIDPYFYISRVNLVKLYLQDEQPELAEPHLLFLEQTTTPETTITLRRVLEEQKAKANSL